MPWLKNINTEQIDFVHRGAVRDPDDTEEPMFFPLVKSEQPKEPHTEMRAHYHEHEDGSKHVHAHKHPADDASHDSAGHGHRIAREDKTMKIDLSKAVWSTADQDDLPDSCFAYIEPGGKVEDGKTVPRSKRHYPIKGPDGKYDRAHVANAASRASAAIKKGGETAAIARHALPKIRAGEKALKMGADSVAKSEAVARIYELSSAETGVASPLALALGEDAAKAILALAQEAHAEIMVTQIAKAEVPKPTAEDPDPDGDGDNDMTPQGDTDHDYWNADGTPTAKGAAVGFTAEQGKASLSKSEESKMSDETATALAKSEQERLAMAEQINGLREQLAKTEAIANQERESRLTREFLAKAEAYAHVPGLSKEELAGLLRTVTEANPEAAEKLETVLRSTDASLAKSELFRERGSSMSSPGGTGALAQMEALAQGIANSEPTITKAQAMARVQREHPDLYQQYRNEQRKAARES